MNTGEKSSTNNIGHKFSITGNVFSTGGNRMKSKMSDIKEPNSGSEIKSAERKESIQEKQKNSIASSRQNSPFLGGLTNLNNSIGQGSSSFITPVLKSQS